MTLWFVFALMTAAAIFAVLLPLGLGGRTQAGGNEAVVYKDQLTEVDSDLAAGLIGTAEAGAARVEIGRRLLAAADDDRDTPVGSSVRLRRVAAVVALIGLPIVAVVTYLPLGSPRLGDFPLAQRAREEPGKQPLDQLVAQVEQHLEKNPNDARGWTVLAPVLARLGRFDDSVRAFRNAIAYGGETADRRADLGEVISAAAAAWSPLKPRASSSARWRWMPMTSRQAISSALPPNRTDASRMPPGSGAQCSPRVRRMRHGGLW